VFAFMYAILFEKELLPVLNDRVVLSYTLIFWYAFLTSSMIDSPNFREWVGPDRADRRTFYVAVSGDTVNKAERLPCMAGFCA